MTVGENIKQARKEQGLTQAKLATLLGVSQAAVFNWESGKREPNEETRNRISEILNRDISCSSNWNAVGDSIGRIRRKRGFTQKRLGELCGIGEATIRKYELGLLNPKLETIEKIAAALMVPAYEIKGISLREVPMRDLIAEIERRCREHGG